VTEKPLEDRAVQTERSEPQETISRRHLLKVLAGAGGAVAAWSLLPGKWTRPVVEAGMLPQSFQASQTLRISKLEAKGDNGELSAVFEYTDLLSQVDDSAKLTAWIKPCGKKIFSRKTLTTLKGSNGLKRKGDASTGAIYFEFTATKECTDVPDATLWVTLEVTGRSASDSYMRDK
jgi:hypothetical protein